MKSTPTIVAMPLTDGSTPTNAKLTRGEITLMALLFSGGAINYMDRATFGILAPLIRKDLALDPAQLGLALGVFSFGYAIFAFVGGWASDRFGPRAVLLMSMIVWSVLCGLTGTATSLTFLLVVRFLFGMSESPWVPSSSKMLSHWFSRDRYAAAIGIAGSGNPFGAAMAGPLLGLTVVLVGWRTSFGVVALIGLAWALVWGLLARDRPIEAPLPEPPRLAADDAYAASVARVKGLLEGISDLIRQPAIVATAFSFATSNYVVTFFLTWFPTYLTSERGVSQVHMSVITAFPWILATLGQIGGGFLSDFLRRRTPGTLTGRKILLVGCLLLGGLFVALVPAVRSTPGAVVMMALSIGILYLSGPNYYAVVNELVSPANIGSAIGLVVVCVTCAGIVSPIVTGYLVKASSSYVSAFAVAGAVSAMGAVVFAIFARSRTDSARP